MYSMALVLTKRVQVDSLFKNVIFVIFSLLIIFFA